MQETDPPCRQDQVFQPSYWRSKEKFEELEKIAEEEIEEIRKLKNGKVGQIWELRKRILGGKKAAMEPTSIINPDNGKAAANTA